MKMDKLTKYILEQQPERVKAANVPNASVDDRMQDKNLDRIEKNIDKTKNDTLTASKKLKSMPAMESKIDRLTLILLENNCGKNKTWNSLKNKCVENPPYDEEQDEEVFGIFAGRKNAANYQ